VNGIWILTSFGTWAIPWSVSHAADDYAMFKELPRSSHARLPSIATGNSLAGSSAATHGDSRKPVPDDAEERLLNDPGGGQDFEAVQVVGARDELEVSRGVLVAEVSGLPGSCRRPRRA
jgi:hypothetical protein